jgi:hypothetical protein
MSNTIELKDAIRNPANQAGVFGTGAGTFAEGNHSHSGVYEPDGTASAIMNSHTQTHAPNNADNTQSVIHGASPKTTPVDADTVGIIDSVASNVVKKLSWANIKATLKTYFDTIYEAAIGAKGTAFNKNFGSNAGDVSEGNHGHTALDFNSGGARVKGATGSHFVAITANEQTANRELKIPALDSNDEIMTLDSLQLITKKKYFEPGRFVLMDESHIEEVLFYPMDQTASDNEVLIPDLNGTITQIMVLADLPQTLKNKTIDAAENTIIGVTADQKISFGTAITAATADITAANHKFKTTDVNRSTAVTLTLKKNVFAVGEWFVLVQTGDGQFTLNGETGVTVPDWKKSAGKGFEMYVYCVDATTDANIFRIVGGVE